MHLRKVLRASLVSSLLVISGSTYAQYSEFSDNAIQPVNTPSKFLLSSDNNTLRISGRVSGYYQYRFMKDDTNYTKKVSGFAVKDLDIDILGTTPSKFIYELHASVIDLVTASATNNTDNPANPGIKAAYISYTGFPILIKLGYDKIPYSQGSLSDVWGTPFWNHSNLTGGDFYSRRDFGLTLNYRFNKNRVNLYVGAYSGMGENFFEYGNDASGKLEYVGRAEYCNIGKMKYQYIDNTVAEKIAYRVAVNARYADKTQPKGYSIYNDEVNAPGKYGIRVIDGKRLAYGADAQLYYKGLSANFEAHIIELKPSDSADALYMGTAPSKNNKVVKAGGFTAGLNYNWVKKKSVFSVMYESVNANDLVVGKQEWLNLAYAYTMTGFNSVFKIQYYLPLTEDQASNPLHYTAQLRVGYQIVF